MKKVVLGLILIAAAFTWILWQSSFDDFTHAAGFDLKRDFDVVESFYDGPHMTCVLVTVRSFAASTWLKEKGFGAEPWGPVKKDESYPANVRSMLDSPLARIRREHVDAAFETAQIKTLYSRRTRSEMQMLYGVPSADERQVLFVLVSFG